MLGCNRGCYESTLEGGCLPIEGRNLDSKGTLKTGPPGEERAVRVEWGQGSLLSQPGGESRAKGIVLAEVHAHTPSTRANLRRHTRAEVQDNGEVIG